MRTIKELETIYNSFTEFPEELQINNCEKIVDFSRFFKSHFSYLKGQTGNKRYLNYYHRLNNTIKLLEQWNKNGQ